MAWVGRGRAQGVALLLQKRNPSPGLSPAPPATSSLIPKPPQNRVCCPIFRDMVAKTSRSQEATPRATQACRWLCVLCDAGHAGSLHRHGDGWGWVNRHQPPLT